MEFAPAGKNPKMTKSQVKKHIKQIKDNQEKAKKKLEEYKQNWELEKEKKELAMIESIINEIW